MRTMLMVALVFAGHISWAQTETKEFDAKTIRSLELENIKGTVKIEGGHEDKLVVTSEKVDFTKSCALEFKQKGSDLDIKIHRKGVFKKSDCTTNFTILVPKVISLDIKNGSGDISVTGTKGEIDFKIGAGHLTVDADVHELEGSSGSGEITVKSLSGDVDLKMGSGSAKITYAAVPASGKFDLKSGSGTVELTMPADAKFTTSFISPAGKMTNEVGETAGSKFKVSVKSGAASLHIKKAL
ncbi:DUF4097 family beta strand repeat-containing protein [Bdellovibrio sp.]|uniref:DUF4097 family beta strand repeat-containing protein n=1 Tax=Bdellovibrio TaxID=958 RepID=UPI0032216A74